MSLWGDLYKNWYSAAFYYFKPFAVTPEMPDEADYDPIKIFEEVRALYNIKKAYEDKLKVNLTDSSSREEILTNGLYKKSLEKTIDEIKRSFELYKQFSPAQQKQMLELFTALKPEEREDMLPLIKESIGLKLSEVPAPVISEPEIVMAAPPPPPPVGMMKPKKYQPGDHVKQAINELDAYEKNAMLENALKLLLDKARKHVGDMKINESTPEGKVRKQRRDHLYNNMSDVELMCKDLHARRDAILEQQLANFDLQHKKEVEELVSMNHKSAAMLRNLYFKEQQTKELSHDELEVRNSTLATMEQNNLKLAEIEDAKQKLAEKYADFNNSGHQTTTAEVAFNANLLRYLMEKVDGAKDKINSAIVVVDIFPVATKTSTATVTKTAPQQDNKQSIFLKFIRKVGEEYNIIPVSELPESDARGNVDIALSKLQMNEVLGVVDFIAKIHKDIIEKAEVSSVAKSRNTAKPEKLSLEEREREVLLKEVPQAIRNAANYINGINKKELISVDVQVAVAGLELTTPRAYEALKRHVLLSQAEKFGVDFKQFPGPKIHSDIEDIQVLSGELSAANTPRVGSPRRKER